MLSDAEFREEWFERRMMNVIVNVNERDERDERNERSDDRVIDELTSDDDGGRMREID